MINQNCHLVSPYFEWYIPVGLWFLGLTAPVAPAFKVQAPGHAEGHSAGEAFAPVRRPTVHGTGERWSHLPSCNILANIYIYRYRDTERERHTYTHTHTYIYIYKVAPKKIKTQQYPIHMYIYVCAYYFIIIYLDWLKKRIKTTSRCDVTGMMEFGLGWLSQHVLFQVSGLF